LLITFRWTKKFNIFEKKYVFIPINIGNSHWTLIVVSMKDKAIR
jgi:Ulp1 family protease